MPHVIRRPGVLGGTTLAAFLAFVHMSNDAVTAILGALLPTVQLRFNASSTLLALIVATYSVASSVTQPLLGALAEKKGLRLIGAIGVLFAAVFLGLFPVATSLTGVFVLLTVGGMGAAAVHPVGTTVAGAPAASNRTLGIGLFTTGGMIGFALGPVLILHIVSRYGVGRTPWLMVPGIVLSILVFALLPVFEPHRRFSAALGFARLRGSLGLLTVASALTSVAFLTFTSSLPIWLVRVHGVPTNSSLIGWTLAVFSLSAGVGALLGGFLAPRVGRRIVLIGSLVVAVAPLALVLHCEPGSVPYFVSAGLAGMLIYTGSPVKVVVAQDLAPKEPASASGVVLGVGMGIAGLLYVGVGQVQELVGINAGILVGFGMLIVAAAVASTVFALHREIGGNKPKVSGTIG
jgi:FSR family fosmidomycin resistance protein-like MFS transporter